MTDELSLHLSTDADAERVRQARSLPGIPHGTSIVPYGSIKDLLERQCERYAEKDWMIFYAEDAPRRAVSYALFGAMVRKTAHMLHRYGIRRGDRICTVSHNHAAVVIQYFAAWYLGAVVVPINIGEDDRRISYMIENSHARLAFVRTPYMDRVRHLREAVPTLEHIIEVGFDVTGDFPSFHDELDKADGLFSPPSEPELSDDALIVYTSGTTGMPKGVVLDQYALLVDAKGIAEWHGIDEETRMMCVLPLHHVNGTVVTLLTPMYAGASVVVCQKFHTHSYFERIAVEQVHIVSVVPTLLQYLLHEGVDASQFSLSHFRHIICGAGPLTCELVQRFESAYGIPILHGYGLSETTCYSCFLPIDLNAAEHTRWLQEYGFPSIGVAIPVNEMDIHSPDGVSMPEGERGEIVIRGHNVMKYYYKNPEANAATFAHGWFRSGDEGFFRTDEQGRKYFFITGRIKELIIRGGVNLAPLEIDEVINACPGVRSGIAVGFDNDWYGEEVGALVVRSDPHLSEDEVLHHCRAALPHSKCPKVVVFGDSIPVTSTGKYQRNRVKHLFAEWKAVQFKGRS
jgi:acyl-CoA synthetase (AMP-forming)/AMP-acid ligase II